MMLNVYVHQFEGAISLGTLPLAAGVIVANAKADPDLRSNFRFHLTADRCDLEKLVAIHDHPSVVALSCYPWNLRYSLLAAQRVKERFQDCMIVLGGQAVPRHPDAAAALLSQHPAVDVLALGEGEVTFRELLLARLHGTELRQVAGLVVRTAESPTGIAFTPPRPRMTAEQLANTPSPFVDGTFDDYLQGRPGLFRALVETNRGCPYSCTFCVWGNDDQRRIYEYPDSRVRQELDWVGSHKVPHLYLVDANFGLMKRDAETAHTLVGVRAQYGYPRSCYLNLTKNVSEKTLEIFEILRAGDINSQVELSMQDTDSRVLKAVRRFNISPERSLALRQRCRDLKLATYNELILGLPLQTYDSFCNTILGALSPLPADGFFVYLCRVVENSEMSRPEHRAAHGLDTRQCVMVPSDPDAMDESVPDYEEIVVATSTLPLEDWRRAYNFSNLVTVFSSMRVIDAVTHYLQFALGANLRVFFERLTQRACEFDGSDPDPDANLGLGGLGRELDRYAQSILSGGPLLLAVEGAGPFRWQVREALLIAAIRRYAALIDEVKALTLSLLASGELGVTADPELLEELFRYQRFATPTFRRRQVLEQRFTTDWLSYQREGGLGDPRRCGDMLLRYQPPQYLLESSDFASFAQGHIAATFVEGGAACLSRVDEGGTCEQSS